MGRKHSRQEMALARERAELARGRFRQRLHAMGERIRPARLKHEAGAALLGKVTGAKAAARRACWRRPMLGGSLALGMVTFLFWKPIRRLAGKLVAIGRDIRDRNQRHQETTGNDE